MESYGSTDVQPDNSKVITDRSTKTDDSLLKGLSKDEKETKKTKGGYPKSVFFILGTEFCERFSYYGMRAILILYLTKQLEFNDDNATGVYHGFIFLCYFSPLIGAILADGYLGRYRTILYLSIIYAIGNILMSGTAVPPPEWYGPMAALILIGLGTGGIKPCVSAFGADQFRPDQEKERQTFFSVFYFMINMGSMFSIILTPMLRADVHCFGEECYPLAFGVPAFLMLASAVIFILGGASYKKVPPTGNLIGRVFRCIYHGIKGKISHKDKRPHWLDHSAEHFETDFIEEVKRLLKVLVICIPLPLYWALYDQQGSRWTLQAEQLDGSVGSLGRVQPDQLQALNPVLILIMIPLFDKLVYPCLDKMKIPNRPLQRMSAGILLNIIAFLMAGFVQLKIDSQFESPLKASESGLTVINSVQCKVTVGSSTVKLALDSFEMSEFQIISPGNTTWNISAGCANKPMINQALNLQGKHSYTILLKQFANKSIDLIQINDRRKKSNTGGALLSVLNIADNVTSVKLVPSAYIGTVRLKTGTTYDIKNYTHQSLDPESYEVFVLSNKADNQSDWSEVSTINQGIGGIYNLLVYNDSGKVAVKLYTSVTENTLSMFVMVPQYIVVTMGEVLFSITGLYFGYSQAPKSMKSFIQAVFLLNSALGNLIVVIISEIRLFQSQATEFFFYALIMLIDLIVFIIIACFYEYVKDSTTVSIQDDTSRLIDNMEMDDNFKTK